MPLELSVLNKARDMCRNFFVNYYLPHLGRGSKYKCFEKNNLKYFVKVVESFYFKEDFDGDAFLRSAMRDGYKYPAQLNSEKLWKNYKEELDLIRQEIKEDDRRIDSAWDSPEILMAKRVVRFFKILNGKSIKDYAENPFLELRMEEWDDICVACFSESFIGSVDISDEDIKMEQSKVKKYPKIFNKIKEKLGDDFKEV